MTENSQNTQQSEEIMEKSTSRALPFDVKKGWTGVPNAIYTVYTKHPDINSTAILVYNYLLRHYNNGYGYAFPPQLDMAISLGVSPGTIKASVAKLKKVELIDVKYNMKYDNNNYYFMTPVETIEEFVAKFPEVEDHLKILQGKADRYLAEAQADKKRLAESRGNRAVG